MLAAQVISGHMWGWVALTSSWLAALISDSRIGECTCHCTCEVAAVGTGLLLGAGVRTGEQGQVDPEEMNIDAENSDSLKHIRRSGRLGPSGGGAHRERRRRLFFSHDTNA